MKEPALGLLLLGGGVAAASALAWRAARARSTSGPASPTGTLGESPRWFHPVPSLGDRPAVISNAYRARTAPDGSTRSHLGADLMFKRRDARDLSTAYPSGTSNGTPWFFMPEGVPALAASDGLVTFAGMTPVGNTVIVKHANGWATYYAHLAVLAVRRGEVVRAGQILGTIGASPKDAARLKHLHFELWNGGTRAGVVDPAPFLAAWSRVTAAWPPASAALVASAAPAAHARRNAKLSAYRPVGDRGEPYPAWVRRLRDTSGVYVIREIGGPILYVGSSVGRLYDTLTRHFQVWRRYKGFWRGQFAEGHDPGLTYDRGSVEVAIKPTSPDDAHEEERRLIRRLQPRDNLIGQPELDEVPF